MDAGRSWGDALLSRLSRRTTGGRWIPEIDGLRFLAIALVLADHVAVALDVATRGSVVEVPFGAASPPVRPDPLLTLLGQGSVGVLVFFMVSGFVLAMPFVRSKQSGGQSVDLWRFFRRRLTRIEPPYLIVMIALFVVVSLGGVRVGIGHLATSLAYLHGTYYGTDSPLNSVAWSLEIEVQFYILVPVLAILLCTGRRSIRRRRTVLIAGALVVGQALGLATAYTFLGASLQYFLLGWLLADIYIVDWTEEPRSSRTWDVVGFAMLPSILAMLSLAPTSVGRALLPWLIFVFGYAIFRSIVLRRMLSNRWVATIGGMCYSIYLIHYPLFLLGSRFLRPLGQLPTVAGLIVASALLIPLALLVAGTFFVLVERPCMDPEWPQRACRRLGNVIRPVGRRQPGAVVMVPSALVGETEGRQPVKFVDG